MYSCLRPLSASNLMLINHAQVIFIVKWHTPEQNYNKTNLHVVHKNKEPVFFLSVVMLFEAAIMLYSLSHSSLLYTNLGL